MNRFLNQTTATNKAKKAAEAATEAAKEAERIAAVGERNVLNSDGTSRLPRPFEDPLIRLQRKMVNENKDHFIL